MCVLSVFNALRSELLLVTIYYVLNDVLGTSDKVYKSTSAQLFFKAIHFISQHVNIDIIMHKYLCIYRCRIPHRISEFLWLFFCVGGRGEIARSRDNPGGLRSTFKQIIPPGRFSYYSVVCVAIINQLDGHFPREISGLLSRMLSGRHFDIQLWE